MRAAIYTRVSSDDQVKGTSLESQESDCRARITAEGWDLVGVFTDPGVSGTVAPDQRPGFGQMLSTDPEIIVAWDMSRVTRSENWFEWRGKTDVRLVTVQDGVDSSGPEMMDGIRVLMHAEDRRKIAVRTARGRRERACEGKWPGGPPPFGYEIEDGRLVVNEEEAETIRRAAELVRDLMLSEVARMLNDEGRLPRQTNPRFKDEREQKWNSLALRRALGASHLTGTYTWGKQAEGEKIEIPVPAILDKRTFARVEKHLEATKDGPRKAWQVYPLSGRLISPCGDTYSGQFDTSYVEGSRCYRCKGRYRDKENRCSCPYFRADKIERQVLEQVMPLLEDEQRLLELTGLDREDDGGKRMGEQVKVLDAKIANLDEAITAGYARALKAGLDPERMQAAVAQLEKERQTLAEKRETAASWQDTAKERKHRRAALSKLARATLKVVNAEHDLGFQKQLLALLDVKVEMTDEGVNVNGVLREADLPGLLAVPVATDTVSYRSSSRA
jgi:DNA invertase Pin-like site-specific DNA recombinase